MAHKNNKYSGRRLQKPELKREGNYTMIPNAFILNPDIKDAELRLLQFIMTNKDDIVITTKNCIRYLGKTKPSIDKSFGRLIESGVLKITDDIIEVIIPEEMKRYKIGYLHGKENLATEVKKTLLSGKKNLTTEVKKINNNPLETIDNDNDTDAIILNNTRVLPVPAKSGSTEQSHSNDNTNGNTGIELDLERDALQSQASPSVLAPSLHTPKGEVGNVGEESSLPRADENSKPLPIEDKTLPIVEEVPHPSVEPEPLPIEHDKRFAEQLKVYNTSKYFLPEKLDKVKNLYNNYAEQYPNKYMKIMDFEKVLVYLMSVYFGRMVDMRGLNSCLMYRNEICHHFKDIPQLRQEMIENPDETIELLRISELNE
jgi:hypothetical protein